MTRQRKSSSTSSSRASSGRATLGGAVAVVVLVIVAIVRLAGGGGGSADKTAVPSTVSTTVSTNATNTPKPASTATTGGTPVANAGQVVAIPGGIDGGWFQLYFTSPINTQDVNLFKGAFIEDALVKAIDSAKSTIDLAVFEFNSQPVTDALIRAKQRGVQVRVVTDGEHGLESPETTLDQLDAKDIPIVSDGSRSAFMHDKFFVIDKQYVWTGSTNITHNDIYNNNNSSLYIRSTQLAQNYTDEFNEMFNSLDSNGKVVIKNHFGPTSPNTIANPDITINGTEVETIFESEGNVPARLIELINNAHTIRFMAFSLTRDDMMQAILGRVKSGQADVMGVVEASNRRFAKPLFCANVQGLQMKQDGNPDILHSKVFIFDNAIVVTGSFNFSDQAANDNDENTLIIHNPDIAKAYMDEFNKRWAEGKTLTGSQLGC
jgi:phosphatidylserine/phosphatidylglycerophosphate/cardiolipin synthase-like enzyme